MMSRKERERLVVMSREEAGEVTLVEAAEMLGVSYRQAGRIKARYAASGAAGLVHRGRGRPSNRGRPKEVQRAVLARYKEKYRGFGPTFAAEKLEKDGLAVDHETLRRWLAADGEWERRRKRKGHRSWRPRREHFGELVQMDGSDHDWFEGRGVRSVLMDMIDDATGHREAIMAEGETTESAMAVLRKWIERHGLPHSLYVDKSTVYVVDEKSRERAADEGREALTQFGRACKELGIKIITANSPEAKGRVERQHGIYQDRLVKEMRLEGAATIEQANSILDNGFMDDLNRRFIVRAASDTDYHRSASGYDLDAIFCIKQERCLTADWIVRFENRFFQLKPPHSHRGMSGRGKVTVGCRADASLRFEFRGQLLDFKELPERPQPAKGAKTKTTKRSTETIMRKYVPPPDHPWRQSIIPR